MTQDTKIFIGIALVTVAVLAFVVLGAKNQGGPADLSLINRGGVATGSAQPQATLVEFSDFQCPACQTAEAAVAKVLETHADKIKFVYRNLPLPQHSLAFKAAQAALAANEQGQFWPYKEKLFANQESLKEESFQQIAADLKLDLGKFKTDLNSQKTVAQVQQDLNDARSLKLPGTPSFFLDGQRLELNSFDDLNKAVEEKLNK